MIFNAVFSWDLVKWYHADFQYYPPFLRVWHLQWCLLGLILLYLACGKQIHVSVRNILYIINPTFGTNIIFRKELLKIEARKILHSLHFPLFSYNNHSFFRYSFNSNTFYSILIDWVNSLMLYVFGKSDCDSLWENCSRMETECLCSQ